jgi:hypothetical protein
MKDEIIYPIRITREIKDKLFLCKANDEKKIGYKIGIGSYIRGILEKHIHDEVKT